MSKQNANNVLCVSIEGNIGSGKSTLLRNLREKYSTNKKIVFVDEPVEDWESIQNEHGTPMLELFYSDQKTHAFAFQMMAFISRLSKLKEAVEKNPDSLIVTERSLYTDQMVFAQMLRDSKQILYEHHQIYLRWFDTFVVDFPVNKIIYVNTPPKICHERIAIRSRNGESVIPLEYLEKCHSYHNAMINPYSTKCVCKDQLVLNGKINIYENKEALEEWLEQIDVFIHKK
jgi:deoxyadenosine/deoxycytidine kinase